MRTEQRKKLDDQGKRFDDQGKRFDELNKNQTVIMSNLAELTKLMKEKFNSKEESKEKNDYIGNEGEAGENEEE